jgi:hypothetical protein
LQGNEEKQEKVDVEQIIYEKDQMKMEFQEEERKQKYDLR